MDDIARESARDRRDLFLTGASKLGLTPTIVEKDFWVCWLLKRVFSLSGFEGAFVFKGGTSLSKVYNAIERFSEDVDLVWDRKSLGFGAEKDPLGEDVSQTKAEKQLIPDLKEMAKSVMREQFLPTLAEAVRDHLNTDNWVVEIEDNEQQLTVLFSYPRVSGFHSAYIKPHVKLELVPLSEPVPSADALVKPYLANAIGEAFTDPDVPLRHILATRTFWEKATILHMYHHYPEEKPFGARFSRHYYDIFRLVQTGHANTAIADPELLRSVVRHKKRFYRSGPAKYDEAATGRLCLVPATTRIEALQADYDGMSEMFFGSPPPLEDILATLREIETIVNNKMAPKATE